MGHEAIGVVEAIGPDVRTVRRGDVVVVPFASSDGTCIICHEGLPTACIHVGFFSNRGNDGMQAEAIRIPFLEGRIQPGRVFDRVVDLDGVPGGYRDMNDRKALKVMVRP